MLMYACVRSLTAPTVLSTGILSLYNTDWLLCLTAGVVQMTERWKERERERQREKCGTRWQ